VVQFGIAQCELNAHWETLRALGTSPETAREVGRNSGESEVWYDVAEASAWKGTNCMRNKDVARNSTHVEGDHTRARAADPTASPAGAGALPSFVPKCAQGFPMRTQFAVRNAKLKRYRSTGTDRQSPIDFCALSR